MININYIIPVFTAIFGGLIVYLFNKHIQKTNNKREKAKQIIEELRSNFLGILNGQIAIIDNMQYLQIYEAPFSVKIKLEENILKNYLITTGLFQIDNGNLEVVYTQDRLFTSCAKKIIENVDVYQSNINKYKVYMNNLNPIDTYPDLEKEVSKLHKSQYGTELPKEDRLPYFLKIVYIIAITGCRNSLTGGRSWIMNFSDQSYSELKNKIQSDVNSKKKADEIITINENIKTSLKNLKKIVVDLHNTWQNTEYI